MDDRPEHRATTVSAGRIDFTTFLKFVFVSTPQLSPSGNHVICSCLSTSQDLNSYEESLWLLSTKEKCARRLIADGRHDQPCWSPDGSLIAFRSKHEEHHDRLCIFDPFRGNVRTLYEQQACKVQSIRWASSGHKIFALIERQDTRHRLVSSDQAQSDPLDYMRIRDSVSLKRESPLAYSTTRIVVVDSISQVVEELSLDPALRISCYAVSPNGKLVVAIVNRSVENEADSSNDQILLYCSTTGESTFLTDTPVGPKAGIEWSNDGDTIVFSGCIGHTRLRDGLNVGLFAFRLSSGETTSLLADRDMCLVPDIAGDSPISGQSPRFQISEDGQLIYFETGIAGEGRIYSVELSSRALTIHCRGPNVYRLGNIRGTTIAMTRGSATELHEVVLYDSGASDEPLKVLSEFNREFHKQYVRYAPKSTQITSSTESPIQAWILTQNEASGARRPAIICIHGGPHGQYGHEFIFEHQLLTTFGFVVVYANIFGSKGYGEEFSRRIRGRWGGDDWLHLQELTRYVKTLDYVDSARIGITGGSYGGYLTAWAVSHSSEYSAAIAERGLYNLVSASATSDVHEPPDEYFPGNFWDRAEERWDQSPLKYAANIKTPTMLVHSLGDLRCPAEQAEQLFTALEMLGVDCRYVELPGSTGHDVARSGPIDLRRKRLELNVEWWKTWLTAQPE